jgi:membrane-associated protein
MDIIHSFIDTFLHLDKYLQHWIDTYHNWVYVLLFAIIFIETGVIIWPWLPGDSLLFVAGTFAAAGSLNITLIIVLCLLAAILGNTSNYTIGKYFGERILNKKFRGKPLVKPEQLSKTHGFFEKYGSVTLIITRFIPIIRTISPFVAGVGKMSYTKFTLFNAIGAILWVPTMTLLGYFFGQTKFVQDHFEFVALGIIAISVLPVVIGLLKRKFSAKNKTAHTE